MKAEQLLAREGIPAVVHYSSGPGGVFEAARHAVQAGATTLIVAGGDGTIHEAVNGLGAEQALGAMRLGIIPGGTGMDLVRTLGLPRDPQRAARVITGGAERAIDIGVSEEGNLRFFANFAEIGLGAAVVAYQRESSASIPGRSAFLLAALRAAVREPLVTMQVEVDGVDLYAGPAVSAVIASGRFFGGGMNIAPAAVVDDGVLNIVLLGAFTRREMLAHIWRLYPGTHVHLPKVYTASGTGIRITTTGSTRLDLDGELYAGGAYAFRVLPRALRVLV
jgi:YegS/Rv2252/BmrU family lipid kinase